MTRSASRPQADGRDLPRASASLPSPRPRRAALLALAIGLPGLLSACYIVPVGGGRGGPRGPDGDDEWVGVPPPPLRGEEIPVAPGPTYLWIGGYWRWQLGRHVWIGGRWALPPAGYVWVPHRWDRGPRGWRARPGHWSRR